MVKRTTEDIQIERGFAIAAETPGEKVAHLISVLSNPLFVVLPVYLAVALHTAPDFLHALLWWGITAIGITAVPFLFIRIGVRRGKYTDDHVSNRAQRFIPLSFGLLCMLLVFVMLLFLAVPRVFLITVAIAPISVACAIAITQCFRFKISLHMVSIAQVVTICWWLFGSLFLLLVPLVVLIGWARWKVRAHTILQACAGTLLGVSATMALFWIAGIR
jgi:hypothetical protein